jgi:hypothetical protein
MAKKFFEGFPIGLLLLQELSLTAGDSLRRSVGGSALIEYLKVCEIERISM